MSDAVDQAVGMAPCLDQQMRRHGEEAEEALALARFGVSRVQDLAESHHGDAAPALLGGKEAPVVQHVAGGRVADVVRGEGESIDAEEHLPLVELLGHRQCEGARLVPLAAVHLEYRAFARSGHLLFLLPAGVPKLES